MSSKFGEIGPWTTELAALERLKFILVDNNDMHENSEEL